jgi:formate dehydrogenase assembly factor FdhD
MASVATAGVAICGARIASASLAHELARRRGLFIAAFRQLKKPPLDNGSPTLL